MNYVLSGLYFIEYLFLAGAYLLGSVPFGLLVGAALHNVDIREHGSGNIGATNVLRKMGPRIGLLVLILDMGKGIVIMILARYLQFGEEVTLVAGFLVVLGHCFPIFLQFQGGKGVATALGVLLSTPGFAIPMLIILLIFLAVVWTTRYVSLGSVVAAALIPVCFFILATTDIFDYTYMHIFFGLGLAGVVIYRHRENISRLLKGDESKIQWGK